jgi:hypothetical protein
MSRLWGIGVGGVVALFAASWVWRAWRAQRHARADFGSISEAWISHHRARERDHDPSR